jgi:hypothetical protein
MNNISTVGTGTDPEISSSGVKIIYIYEQLNNDICFDELVITAVYFKNRRHQF